MRVLNVDVLFGRNELTNTTSFLNQIDEVEIRNGTFQHVNIINECDINIDNVIPTSNSNTIMDCDFNSLNGGNIDELLSNLNRVYVKKRERGKFSSISEGWTTVASIGIVDPVNFQFVVHDYITANNVVYEYVLVPTLIQEQGGVNIEVESAITNNSTILEGMISFDSVFVCDVDDFQKLNANVSYGDNTYTQMVGVHDTMGSKYPIVVSNSAVDYAVGSVGGTILNKGYGRIDSDTGDIIKLNREQIVKAREEFLNLITNHKPKILKDWNGNMWLIMMTESPTYTFVNEWGMGLGEVQFTWTEIGDPNNELDLEQANMIYQTVGEGTI